MNNNWECPWTSDISGYCFPSSSSRKFASRRPGYICNKSGMHSYRISPSQKFIENSNWVKLGYQIPDSFLHADEEPSVTASYN